MPFFGGLSHTVTCYEVAVSLLLERLEKRPRKRGPRPRFLRVLMVRFE